MVESEVVTPVAFIFIVVPDKPEPSEEPAASVVPAARVDVPEAMVESEVVTPVAFIFIVDPDKPEPSEEPAAKVVPAARVDPDLIVAFAVVASVDLIVTSASTVSEVPRLKTLPVASFDPVTIVFDAVVLLISFTVPSPLNSLPAPITVPVARTELTPRVELAFRVEAWVVDMVEPKSVPFIS